MSIKFRDQKIEAIVLDFDGTFYANDSEIKEKVWAGVRHRLIQKIFDNLGNDNPSDEEFEAMISEYAQIGEMIGWPNAFIELGGNIDDYYEITNFVSKAEHLKFDEQLMELIKDLIKHLPVYIFTGSGREAVLKDLEVLIGDLATYFEDGHLLASDDMKTAKKPDWEAYHEMIVEFEVDPDDTIFVDDSLAEVKSAMSLGFITFLIREDRVQDEQGRPLVVSHAVIASILELINNLEISD